LVASEAAERISASANQQREELKMECIREECEGTIEASAKVYLDVEAKRDREHGGITITEIRFSHLNDHLDGHPIAMESEIRVHCADCGKEYTFDIASEAIEDLVPQPVGG
jgi:hypothetical protein